MTTSRTGGPRNRRFVYRWIIFLSIVFLFYNYAPGVMDRQYLDCNENPRAGIDKTKYRLEACGVTLAFEARFPMNRSLRPTDYIRVRRRDTHELILEIGLPNGPRGPNPPEVIGPMLMWAHGDGAWTPWPPSWWTRFAAKLP